MFSPQSYTSLPHRGMVRQVVPSRKRLQALPFDVQMALVVSPPIHFVSLSSQEWNGGIMQRETASSRPPIGYISTHRGRVHHEPQTVARWLAAQPD